MTELIVLGAICVAGWYFREPIIAFLEKTFGSAE